MFGQKNRFIALIGRSSLHIFGDGDNAVQILPLPATIVSNIEVLNKDDLYTLITDWTKQKTYQNTEIIWILSSEICFTHVIENIDQEKIDSETLQFLDTVPFENVISNSYSTSTGKQIIATNQDLVNTFIQGFALHGYVTQSVIPDSVVGISSVLTVDNAKAILRRANELKKESMIATNSEVKRSYTPPPVIGSVEPKPKSSLPLLLSVFVGLLVVLVAVIVYSRR
jgi:hypothetical protein